MNEMLLKDLIQIQQSYLRSIRIEEDLWDKSIVQSYLPTAQAIYTLERIFHGIENNGGRAWTLTGPYGAGKSFFGVFLSHVLDSSSAEPVLNEKLRGEHPQLAERIQNWINQKGNFLTIPVTGARSSLQSCILRGVEKALPRLGTSLPEGLTAHLEQLKSTDNRLFLDGLRKFIAELRLRFSFGGLLLVFDELGKALEHAAAHPLENDIYLLQELAEFANRSGDTPFVFVGVLHQAFEQYAAFLDHVTQREWAKVQGRFEDIPFLEPPAQQIRLMVQAFVTKTPNLPIQSTDLSHWQPELISHTEFAKLCQKAYPLHPSVLAALPFIFRKLGQNERSLFTYLTSQEPFGFQEFLITHHFGEYIRLPDLFDYLAANYEGRLYASGRARPLTETIERLSSTSNLSPEEQSLLKTIALLNWLSENSPLKANEERILSALVETPEQEVLFRAALAHLKQQSMIAYRSFNQTYVIWQGSDVDIEERLQASYAALPSTFSIAEVLQNDLSPRPLIARRHSYETGTLRFFNVQYVDVYNYEKVSIQPSDGASGMVILCLPTSLSEVELFNQWAQQITSSNPNNLIIGVASRALRLKEYVQELRGLHWVKDHTPEMRGDRVAEREWRARLAMMESLIRKELEETLDLYRSSTLSECQWFFGGEEVSALAMRGLPALLSTICDRLYPATPRIWNEILNRRSLTTQGAAARRNLIEGILTRSDQPLLGIQKYPPERSMYEALLRKSGIHRLDGEKWRIGEPEPNELNLLPAWQAIYVFVFGGLPEPKPINQLYSTLAEPPFGVTTGVAPVLLAAFYKCHDNEVTLYKEGTLLVEPDIADWEVLLRRPELFSIAGCRVSGLRAAVVERMARGLRVPPQVMPVVRAVIGRLRALPEYAWRTRNLPIYALNLRRAIETTRSPERFLFVEVPQALELPPFEETDFDPEQFDIFFERLNLALDALANATPRLTEWARRTWLVACGLPPDDEGWELFRREAEALARRATHPQLAPLLKRAAEATDSRAALESVLAYIANRPLRTWNDSDAERFEAQAKYLGGLFRAESDLSPHLDPDAQGRAHQLVDQLESLLRQSSEKPEVLEYTLRMLLERLKNWN